MTALSKNANIAEELRRGRESLQAADVLAERGLLSDAISRLYYFVFHSARALLYTKGFEPKSHEGLLRLIGMHFVRTGTLSPNDSHLLTRLQKYRSEADYNAAYAFTAHDYEELKSAATQLDTKIQSYLKEQGFGI